MRTSGGRKNYLKRRYDIQRAFFLELLGGACVKCKAEKRLEIDHIDPTQKTMNLGRLFSRRTIVAAITELLTKCQALCKTCHVEKTRREASAKPPTFQHGTMYAWLNLKCRCDVCRPAWRAWHDARNEKRRRASSELAQRLGSNPS